MPEAMKNGSPLGLGEQQSVEALDLEVKDAHVIFQSVWQKLEQEVGLEGLRFPKEVIWLNGAPGAGKGTQTRFIMEFRGLTTEPIVVSSLLQSPDARRLIDSGLMVGDREVTELVLRALMDPRNETGVVVDGYPRTQVQVVCLKLLYEKLLSLRQEYMDTPQGRQFHKPMFHIVVLFVDEEESVRRQVFRGEMAVQRNREVEASGVGTKIELRNTDLSRRAARKRYQTFKEVTYESLRSLREVFFYHYINAHGTIEEVQRRIEAELRYQSSLELDQRTLDQIRRIPEAGNLGRHARQELVKRLDSYVQDCPAVFAEAVKLIDEKFVPIIHTHAISGRAYINSENLFLETPDVLAMIIDVFSERGYRAVVDIRRYEVPLRVNRDTFEIERETRKVWRFLIEFPESEIRRGR